MSNLKEQVNEFREQFSGDKMREQIALQLPKGIDPDRFIRTAVSTIQVRPELLRADRTSLFASFMEAAKDGLLPDDKQATIQIYRTNVGTRDNPQWVEKAQYMPMVAGLIAKMYEAGCTYVDGAAVYEKDHFRFQRGDNPSIDHEPYLGDEDPGPIVAAYAIIKMSTGETKREVMPKRDLNKVREASKASNGPGWTKWEDQFCIKAVLKRAYKQVDHRAHSVERIIEHDNDLMGFDFKNEASQQVGREQQRAITSGKSTRLQDIVGTGRTADPQPAEAEQAAPAAETANQEQQHDDRPDTEGTGTGEAVGEDQQNSA